MIEILFRRKPHEAWCDVDGRRFDTKGEGSLYRLLTELNTSGFAGRRWTAHDGRMVCAHGYVRDFTYDAKNGRPPRREWYEKNIGPWPTPEPLPDSGAKPSDGVPGPSEASERPPER